MQRLTPERRPGAVRHGITTRAGEPVSVGRHRWRATVTAHAFIGERIEPYGTLIAEAYAETAGDCAARARAIAEVLA